MSSTARRVLKSKGGSVPAQPPPAPSGGIPSVIFTVGHSLSVSAGEPTAAYKWGNRLEDKMQARYGTRPNVQLHGAAGTRLSTTRLLTGLPVNFTVSGGQIPASGGVTIIPDNPELDIGEHTSGVWARSGFRLRGLAGTITRPGGRPSDPITFTRDVAGTAVAAPGALNALTYQPGIDLHTTAGLIVWAGDNNASALLGARRLGTPYVAALAQEILAWWTGPKLWLSISTASKLPQNLGSDVNGPGLPGGTLNPDWTTVYGTGTGGFWGHLAAAVGAPWVNVKDGLISTAPFDLSGIVPTAKDLAQIGEGKRYIPQTLSSDLAHPDRYGEEFVAQTLFDRIVADWA